MREPVGTIRSRRNFTATNFLRPWPPRERAGPETLIFAHQIRKGISGSGRTLVMRNIVLRSLDSRNL